MAIRVTVAGMGERGREWAREVQADPAYELAACVDPDPAVLRRASADLRVPHGRCFAALQDALDRFPCEAVVVATPPDRHTAACEAALARGVAVLVEKPFTLRLDEAVGLVALAERKGAPLVVAQNHRYTRSHRTARRLVRGGALGRVGMVFSQYYRVPHEMVSSLASLPHSVLWGMGVHHLDALRYVLGQEVVGVSAQGFTLPWGGLPEGASMQAMLTFSGGTRGMYSATYESSGHEYFERGQEFYQRFVGERATLHVFHRWLVLCERGKWPRPVWRGPRPVTEESLLLRQLERALVHGEEPDASGRDNLGTMAALEAYLRSDAERRWVDPRELLEGAGS